MKWIHVVDAGKSDSGKTNRWTIRSVEGNAILGAISWYGPWRKYVFQPDYKTIFEEDCLRDIADFCEEKTKEHRAVRKEALDVAR